MKRLISRTGLYFLLWTELITTFIVSTGLPLDYNAYPTTFSYVGEHVLVWLMFLILGHLVLSMFKLSPFKIKFASVWRMLGGYLGLGLYAELSSSLWLWHLQAASRSGVKIWVDIFQRDHAFRAFMFERLLTWSVVFSLTFLALFGSKLKGKFLNRISSQR